MPTWAAGNFMETVQNHLGITKKNSMWTNMSGKGLEGGLMCFC